MLYTVKNDSDINDFVFIDITKIKTRIGLIKISSLDYNSKLPVLKMILSGKNESYNYFINAKNQTTDIKVNIVFDINSKCKFFLPKNTSIKVEFFEGKDE